MESLPGYDAWKTASPYDDEEDYGVVVRAFAYEHEEAIDTALDRLQDLHAAGHERGITDFAEAADRIVDVLCCAFIGFKRTDRVHEWRKADRDMSIGARLDRACGKVSNNG